MRWLSNPKAPLVAFIILATAIAYLFVAQRSLNRDAIYRAQIGGCERTNLVIEESNDRIPKLRLQADVLQQFLDDAAKARAAGKTKLDKKTAERYRKGSRELERLRFDRVEKLNCNKVVPRP